MKHLITALCALTLVGLTAQADVTIRFNGIKVGNQWGGGAVSGPGVSSIALNTSNPNRVKENVEAGNTHLPAGFWDALRDQGLLSVDYPGIIHG